MKGNRPVIIIGFVLYGLTIVFWIALCVWSLLQGRFNFSLFLGAAVWIIWFAATLRRYLGREKDEDE